MTESDSEAPTGSPLLLAVRGALGGVLMGLANLVPGISGGTMLLAAGVYPAFISGIAEVTTFRFRSRSILLLASVVTSAALAILFLAGTVKGLVVDHRWRMYSLFIGLTLGGVPLVWRMAKPASSALAAGALAGFAAMLWMGLGGNGTANGGDTSVVLMFLSGLAGASAMILPGVSGGYLLLILGQYESILGTIDQIKRGLVGDAAGRDWSLVFGAMDVVIPLGIGIVVGVVGVSNLLRWLLERYEKATLGVLLGLLLGAVVGLWPFEAPRAPVAGETLDGIVLSAETAATVDPEDWPLDRFQPSVAQGAGALVLVVAGFAATVAIGRFGRTTN